MKPKIKTVRRNKKIKRVGAQTLPQKEWVRHLEIQKAEQRGMAIKWLLLVFTATLCCVLGIFLFAGFHLRGFSLPETVLNKLAWLTIGQVAGLAGIAFKFLFH